VRVRLDDEVGAKPGAGVVPRDGAGDVEKRKGSSGDSSRNIFVSMSYKEICKNQTVDNIDTRNLMLNYCSFRFVRIAEKHTKSNNGRTLTLCGFFKKSHQSQKFDLMKWYTIAAFV
jgi:hypothetical protein